MFLTLLITNYLCSKIAQKVYIFVIFANQKFKNILKIRLIKENSRNYLHCPIDPLLSEIKPLKFAVTESLLTYCLFDQYKFSTIETGPVSLF